MDPYAVIETGGKQYRITENSVLQIEKLDADAGNDVTFDNVLAVSDGSSLTVGSPYLDGVAIQATVIEQFRGPKIYSFKFKRRKGYKKKIGHRQSLTKVKIQPWTKGSSTKKAAPAKEAAVEEVEAGA